MRAGWILLKIRHKQYGVNVDEVGADIIRPHNPISDAMAVKSLRQCLRHCHLPFQGRQIGFKISAPLAKGGSGVAAGGIAPEVYLFASRPSNPHKNQPHSPKQRRTP